MLTGISLIPWCKAISAMCEHDTVHWRGVLSFDTWPISSLFFSRNNFMDLPLSNVTLLCSPIHYIHSLEVGSLHTYPKCSLQTLFDVSERSKCSFLPVQSFAVASTGFTQNYWKRGYLCSGSVLPASTFFPTYHIHGVLMQLWSSCAEKNSLILCQGIITKESQQPGCDPTQHFHLLRDILIPWGYKYVRYFDGLI